ncbi:MAG: hypothetical protein JSR99_03360 [Proteobacteria bacterium]|nr:hypothetical protein [Pseudomonadota bacterium]
MNLRSAPQKTQNPLYLALEILIKMHKRDLQVSREVLHRSDEFGKPGEDLESLCDVACMGGDVAHLAKCVLSA